MKEKINKFTKVFMAFAILITQLIIPMPAIALSEKEVKDNNKIKGIVYNPQTVSVGNKAVITDGYYANGKSYGSEGDVEIQKIVSKTSTEGKYEVEFKMRGIPTKKGTEVIKPVYVVIVLDASNSMDNPSIAKWNNAVNGAIDFEKELLKKVPNAKIALVKFAGKSNNKNWSDATTIRGFNYDKNNRLTASNIGGIGVNGGATNLGEGLRYAYNLLKDSAPANAVKYVVALSDGVPTIYTEDDGDSATTSESNYATRYDTKSHEYATTWANKIKSKTDLNATLISVGYELDALEFSKDKRMAPLVLKGIATNNNFYIDADMSDVVSKVKNISSLIETTYYPATDIKVQDKLGNEFSLSSGKTNLTLDKVTSKDNFQSLGKFYITIPKDTPDGWYATNNDFTWSFDAPDGTRKTITCTDDPEVYWEAQRYNYIVNYYKDEITNPNDSSHFINSYTASAPHGAKVDVTSDDLLLKYLPANYNYTGVYNDNGVTPITSITVDKNGNNVINVLYNIKEYKYTVNYYYANVNNGYSNVPDMTKEFPGIEHGSAVLTADHYLEDKDIRVGFGLDETKTADENLVSYSIVNDETVIDIFYKRNNYEYIVNYHFNGVKDENLIKHFNGIYGSEVFSKDKYLEDIDNESYNEKNTCDKTEYFLEPTNPSNNSKINIKDEFRDNFVNNVLNIYYVDTKVINENITKESQTDVVTDADTAVSYTVNYNSVINNVPAGKEIIVTIEDQLPFEIDEEKSTLYSGDDDVDVSYDKETKTITWIYKETPSNFTKVYNISKTIDYTVVYKDFAHISSEDENYIINTVNGKTTVGNISTKGVSSSEKIKVLIEGKLIVNYVTTDGKKLTDTVSKIGLVGSSYQTEQKTFDNYSFVKVIGDTEGKLVNGVTEVTYVYEFLPLPPQTGGEDNSSKEYLLLILLLPLVIRFIKH